jgi:hypothetical protein
LLERAFVNPFVDGPVATRFFDTTEGLPPIRHEIVDGAFRAAELYRKSLLLSEEETVLKEHARDGDEKRNIEEAILSNVEKDLVISLRISFTGLVTSLIDSSPTEICLLSFKNINAIATWNTQRTTDSTVFITVTSLQVDNMLPSASFPVAVCPDDSIKSCDDGDTSTSESPPLLVIGLSFAPRHQSGIVVR